MKENIVNLDYGCPMCQRHKPEEGFVVQPVAIQRSLNAPRDFKCPQCGSIGHYQFRQWEGTEHIQWSLDHRLSFLYMYDCPQCGGKLTEYVTIGKYADRSVCRHCGKTREGNLTGYR
jgi:transcription elongation factor Elf1